MGRYNKGHRYLELKAYLTDNPPVMGWSVPELSKKLNMHPPSIRNLLKRMVEDNFLERVNKKDAKKGEAKIKFYIKNVHNPRVSGMSNKIDVHNIFAKPTKTHCGGRG